MSSSSAPIRSEDPTPGAGITDRVKRLEELCFLKLAEHLNLENFKDRIQLLPPEPRDALFNYLRSRQRLIDPLIDAFALPNLTSIDLTDCQYITEDALNIVASRTSRLVALRLARCRQVTDAFVHTVTAQLRLHGLELLSLSMCQAITDKAVDSVAAHLPGLLSLDLSYCNGVSNSCVRKICDAMTKLEVLDIGWCPGITDRRFRRLRQLVHLRQLDVPDLVIADSSIQRICACPALRCLNLNGCPAPAPALVQKLCQYGTALRELSLSCANGLTDSDMQKLCAALTHLEVLVVSQNAGLTEASLSHLRALTALQMLDLSMCTGIEATAVPQLQKDLPHLQHLSFHAFSRGRD